MKLAGIVTKLKHYLLTREGLTVCKRTVGFAAGTLVTVSSILSAIASVLNPFSLIRHAWNAIFGILMIICQCPKEHAVLGHFAPGKRVKGMFGFLDSAVGRCFFFLYVGTTFVNAEDDGPLSWVSAGFAIFIGIAEVLLGRYTSRAQTIAEVKLAHADSATASMEGGNGSGSGGGGYGGGGYGGGGGGAWPPSAAGTAGAPGADSSGPSWAHCAACSSSPPPPAATKKARKPLPSSVEGAMSSAAASVLEKRISVAVSGGGGPSAPPKPPKPPKPPQPPKPPRPPQPTAAASAWAAAVAAEAPE